jgi:fermentation-respiration switch protein FrsA (DUF1100 family)
MTTSISTGITAALGRVLLRLALLLIGFAALGYLGIAAYAADRFSHPDRLPAGPCADYHLVCEDVQFTSSGDSVLLRGWFIHTSGTRTILMLHGRNGRRDDPAIGMMDIAQAFVRHGYSVLLFDFRAHGTSGGDRYSLGDWERCDIAGTLRFLQSRGITAVGAIGFSMGGGTLLRATPDHPELRAVVLDSPLADLTPLIEVQLTEVSGLPRFFAPGIIGVAQVLFGMDLVDNRPEEEMARLGDRSVLLIHSTTDDYIPISQAYALQRAGATDPHLQVWFPVGPAHARAFKENPTEYLRRALGFFDRNLA